MEQKILLPICLLAAASCSSDPGYDAQGTFEATEITVSAEGTGKILSFDVEQGQNLAEGRIIGQIDTLQLSLQLQELMQQCSALESSRPDMAAQIASLQEQISGVKTERDRIVRLLKEGAATQQQLDNLNTQLASLQGELAARKSSIGNNASSIDNQIDALTAKSQAIRDQIAKCTVTAPISGTVLDKIAETGEVTSFGKPLLKMADMDNIYLRAYFTSDQLSGLKLGQKVKVTADYGGGNEKEYDGVISYISSQSEFTPKTIQTRNSRANLVYAVKIAVKNDGHLKIGLTGNVYVGDNNK